MQKARIEFLELSEMPTLIWVIGRIKMTKEKRMMSDMGTMIISA